MASSYLADPKEIQDNANAAYEYGRNVGIAFQLVDDLLDFVSSSEMLGKPAAADLKLGLATAPVLFASKKYPELEDMIARRFNQKGDVEKAFQFVSYYLFTKWTKKLAKNFFWSEFVSIILNFN